GRRPMSPSAEDMRDAVDRYFAAWASLDPVAYTACFSDEAVLHDPYGSTPLQGAKALREFFSEIAQALQEVRLEAEAVHVAGNRAAVVFRGKAIGKNQRPAEVVGVDVFEFDTAGRITILWAYWDSAAVLTKLRQ
ncbi:MAG TPA: nuclear transport factor 2 family protein, partial [Nitrospiraceae bacterium]